MLYSQRYAKLTQMVTASVDRIDMLREIPICDVKMSGHVTYVGKSSVEISLNMSTCPDGAPPENDEGCGYDASFKTVPKSETIFNATFIMVFASN